MGCGVVVHGWVSQIGVNHRLNLRILYINFFPISTNMDNFIAIFLGINYFQLKIFANDLAFIANLTTAFGIERGFVQNKMVIIIHNSVFVDFGA